MPNKIGFSWKRIGHCYRNQEKFMLMNSECKTLEIETPWKFDHGSRYDDNNVGDITNDKCDDAGDDKYLLNVFIYWLFIKQFANSLFT